MFISVSSFRWGKTFSSQPINHKTKKGKGEGLSGLLSRFKPKGEMSRANKGVIPESYGSQEKEQQSY